MCTFCLSCLPFLRTKGFENVRVFCLSIPREATSRGLLKELMYVTVSYGVLAPVSMFSIFPRLRIVVGCYYQMLHQAMYICTLRVHNKGVA